MDASQRLTKLLEQEPAVIAARQEREQALVALRAEPALRTRDEILEEQQDVSIKHQAAVKKGQDAETEKETLKPQQDGLQEHRLRLGGIAVELEGVRQRRAAT